MARIFDPENGFFSALSSLVDIVGLSILWAVLCLPVVTIGPATAALYHTMYYVFREHASGTFGRFFRSLWKNLKQGVLATLILIPAAFLLVLLDFWYGQMAGQGGMGTLAYGYFLVLAAVLIGFVCWLFPLLGRFTFTLKQLFSTAARMAVAHLPTTILAAALTVATIMAVLWRMILLFVLPAVLALVLSYPLERAFRKHITPPEEEPEEE